MHQNNKDTIKQGGTYQSRCNISLLSNYILYLIFISQTIAFTYYAFIYQGEKAPCYANYFTNTPMTVGAGRDITSRFDQVLQIGSICGILEVFRNSLNLWAKCFNHQKLAIASSILGFITAFLFILNFILMQLWRFEHAGRMCSGDLLTPADYWDAPAPYMPRKGFFIQLIIFIIYGMIVTVGVSVLAIAGTLKYQQNKRMSVKQGGVKFAN